MLGKELSALERQVSGKYVTCGSRGRRPYEKGGTNRNNFKVNGFSQYIYVSPSTTSIHYKKPTQTNLSQSRFLFCHQHKEGTKRNYSLRWSQHFRMHYEK